MSLRSRQFRKPSVYVTESQFDRLWDLAESRATRGAAFLGDELVRAVVLKDGDNRRAFVRLHSFVSYTDLTTGRSRRVQIVPPEEADIDRRRLSVLTPIGAALIGLPEGESIGVSTDDGRAHVLRVETVEPQHEVA